jgi:hypothetical protein
MMIEKVVGHKTNNGRKLAADDASYANGQVYGSSGGSGQP